MAAASQIIDTHVHILQPSRFDYHWLKAGSALDKDFCLADVREEMKSLGVVGGILIEAANTPEEISWLLEISETDDLSWGVIGWINLEQADTLEHVTYFARHPNFRGVRLNWLQPRSQTALLSEAVSLIGGSNLVVDVLAGWEYLSDITAFISAHTGVSFILEHLGGTAIPDTPLPAFRAMMQPFAALPNVAVKISGYTDPALHNSAQIPFRAYVEVALDLFGSHRLMFGSNYPMNTTSYAEIVTLLQQATDDLGETVQTALFYETARQIYHFS
ncbi:MAG: amidohydrolase family protein [Armatimonadetes bacterium]|nr:amidohydrolase family protein [Anaerolineae bacterium]